MAIPSGRTLYLDVDGVLVGKEDPASAKLILARHAQRFLEHCLERFDCFWLTSHCRHGDAGRLLRHLGKLATPQELELLREVRPTSWQTLKTEAIDLVSDFYWLDDSPLQREIELLESRGILHRWIPVDTRRRPDDLRRVMTILQRIGNKVGGGHGII